MSKKKFVYSPTQSRNGRKTIHPAKLYTYSKKSNIILPRCKYCDPKKLNCKKRDCVNWHKLCSNANDCSHYINE